MASCIFRDIFGVTRLWSPEFFLGIFLECPGNGLRYFSGMVFCFLGVF